MALKYIRDPVHGYISITDVERHIIDTWPVQRLRGIKQLSIASIVYPGGEHTRFSHALGAMHVAGQIADSLKKSVEISDDERQLVRLAGLLHDIGHGPFSHSYEELLAKKLEINHEQMGERVVRESELADVLSDNGFKPAEIIELAFGKESRGKRYLHQITSSQVDADKLDFLVRDSYYTGVEYGRIDISRLIQAMDVCDNDISIDLKALYALEAFIIARYEMFLAVYYHRAVRSAEILLQKAMEYADELIGLTDLDTIEKFLKLDDAYLVTKMRELNPIIISDPEKKRLAEKAKETMKMLDSRELLKVAYQRDVHIRDSYVARLLSDKGVRHQKEVEIAKRAGIESDDVVVDVPTLDSVPYYPREIDPMEIPVFTTMSNGNKEFVQLSRYSRLINVLKGYVDVIRVYTSPKHRINVEKAAEEVFKTLPFSAQISM